MHVAEYIELEGVLLGASDRVRRNSLVLRLVAEAVEVHQDRLAVQKWKWHPLTRVEGKVEEREDLSACSKSVIITWGARMILTN